MNCNNCTNSNTLKEVKIKHVHGNVLRMAIPLTLRTIELVDGEINATDTPFVPSSEHPVKVVFSKGSVSVALDATMKDGNIAYVEEKGKIPVGTYAITVTCNDDNGNPYRFKQNAVLYVADATIEAGIEETIEYEVTTWYLDAAIFLALKGEDGVGIDDIETQSSGEIGGVNTVTFILTDGRTRSFNVLNGSGAVDSDLDINSQSPIANSAVTAKFNELAGELADLFGDVDYDTSSKSIRFWDKGKTNVLASLDARPFIKDGMVSNAYISNNTLVITFNTDSGKEAIGVPLTTVFNPNNYYTKTQVDSRIASAVANINLSNYYTKAQTDAKLSQKVNLDATTGRVDASQATRVVLDYIVGIYDGEDEPSHDVNAGDVWYDNGQIHYAYNNDVIVVIKSLGAPQKGIIYCNAESNKLYRWNGSEFVQVGGGNSDGGYEPPVGGIPKSDLAQSVQDTLDDVSNKVDKVTGKGLSTEDYTTTEKQKLAGLSNYDDTEIQAEVDAKYEKPSTGIPKTDLSSNVQASLGKADTALQSSDLEGYATTDDVDDAVAALVSSAPQTLDTLKELADALGDDPNFATTMATQLGNKVDKETGKSLMTDAERTKLQGIAAGAEVNVQPNWTQTNTSADDYIKNKPTLATVATSGSYNDLQDKPPIPAGVTVDSTITQNGTNPVRGSAIYSALATKMQRVYIFMENNSGTLSFTNINGDVLSHQDVIAILKNNMNNVVLIYDRTYVLDINEYPASERTYWWFSYINNVNTANKRFIGLTTDDEISIYIDETSGENLLDAVVPVERKINNKPLSSDITLNASDVGALPASTTIPSKTSDLTNDSGFIDKAMYYGTSETAAATMPKVCTVETFPTTTSGNVTHAKEGTIIAVKFTNSDTNTTDAPKLNVNSIGAKAIMYNNAIVTSTAKNTTVAGYAKQIAYYRYDPDLDEGNGAWEYLGKSVDSNSTYSNASLGQGYATQSNSAAATAITASISNSAAATAIMASASSYALSAGGIVTIKFTYDVPANATLNINSKGAKAIYNKGAAITAGVIKAGDTATFIYSTYYYLLSVDSWQDKQDAISDLATIRSGAAAGATALQSYTETDPTVPAWAKANTKPSYTASEVGAVPTTRTVNGKALSSNITLSASDVGALPSNTHIPADQVQSNWDETDASSKAYIQNKPAFKTINGESVVGTGDVTVQGEQGPAGTITVGDVSSGPTASVTNSGTASAAVLNFVLPKGDKGEKGDTGASGVSLGEIALVQTTGSSTTSVMSQKAVTDMVVNDFYTGGTSSALSAEMGKELATTQRNALKGFSLGGETISTKNYRTFLFDDIKFLDVHSRYYYASVPNGSQWYEMQNLFSVRVDSQNYITVVGSSNNLWVRLYKNGTVIHSSEKFPVGTVYIQNCDIRFDFYNKKINFYRCTTNGTTALGGSVDISEWDLSAFQGNQVYFTKQLYKAADNPSARMLFTYIRVNDPTYNTLPLYTTPYTVDVFESSMTNTVINMSGNITGLYSVGATTAETISSTHKVFSVNRTNFDYTSFFGTGSGVYSTGKVSYAVKFKILSGTPVFGFGQNTPKVLLDDGTTTRLSNFTPEIGTEYTMITEPINSTDHGYLSNYSFQSKGTFTIEVYDPIVIIPQRQLVAAETYFNGIFTGNIPFYAANVSFEFYAPVKTLTQFFHQGELRFSDDKIYMWTGTVWKQISNA